MRFVRGLLLILVFAAGALLIVRAAVGTAIMPFMYWRLFRESGYPWWIQVPAAVALILGFAFLFKSGALTRR